MRLYFEGHKCPCNQTDGHTRLTDPSINVASVLISNLFAKKSKLIKNRFASFLNSAVLIPFCSLIRLLYFQQDEESNAFVNGHSPHAPNVSVTKSISRPTHLRLDTSTASSLNQSAAAAAATANYVDAEHGGRVNSGGDHISGVDQSAYCGAVDYTSASAPQQRLDNLLDYSNNAPPPPERGSSFAVMSQTYRSPAVAAVASCSPSTPSQNYSAKQDASIPTTNSTKKVVSFQETTREIPPPSTPVEKVLEDPNVSVKLRSKCNTSLSFI